MFWAQWVIEYSEGEAYLHSTLELKSWQLSKYILFYVSIKYQTFCGLFFFYPRGYHAIIADSKISWTLSFKTWNVWAKRNKVSPQFFCVELCVFCAFLLEWVTLASAATILFIYFHKNEHFLHFLQQGVEQPAFLQWNVS